MSEPLSSHEIEDVLSSIRRLVSEDLRPTLRQTGANGQGDAPPSKAPAETPDKLVLTQALRVVPCPPHDGAEQDKPADATAIAAEIAPASPRGRLTLDQPSMAVEDMLSVTDLSDGPVDPYYLGTDAANAGGPDVDWDGDLIWASGAAADSDVIEEDTLPHSDSDLPVLESDTDAPRRGHWTAETVPQVAWIQDEDDWSGDETLAFAPHRRDAEPKAAQTDDPLARVWADRAESEVRAKLHAELARERPEGIVPPDAGAPPPPRDHGHGGGNGPGGGGGSTPGGPGLFDGSDPGLDEEMLRDIVREIIREELAGTLGERITRNVRKLVRVEINRALTAREFE